MRCISYTRATSCNRLGAPIFTINEQNDHIREFAKANGLKIQKKYTDRGNDPESVTDFEKMRNDGLNRTFDVLVFDSFWQCGKDIFNIVRVLKESFYPAGIQFAVVQENYCSAWHEHNEVMQYLDDIWGMYWSHLAEARQQGNPYMQYIETFGFRYDEENDVLRIDVETANTVREIFKKIKQGKSMSEVARDLNERGAETPGDYLSRMRGWAPKGESREWTDGRVKNIVSNPKFAGRWEKINNGKNYADDCEPIIDPELFDEVQRILDQRRHHKKPLSKYNNPFLKMMTDEETGAKVIMKKNQKTGEWDFHFKPRKPEGVRYERTCMYYQEAIDQMRAALKREYEDALAAAALMDTDRMRSWKNNYLEEARRPLPALLKEFMQYTGDKFLLPAYFEAGKISEPVYRIALLATEMKCKRVSDDLTDIYEEIAEIEKRFSLDNPWIKLFSRYDENHELTASYLKKFCSHVNIWRFEKIKPVFKESEWRKLLLTT